MITSFFIPIIINIHGSLGDQIRLGKSLGNSMFLGIAMTMQLAQLHCQS